MIRRLLAVAAVLWLFIDVLRVWTPSLITIFGQAAETPPEFMGAFALACFLVPFGVLALIGFAGAATPVAWGAMVVITAVCRIVLQIWPGGNLQLWTASIGVVAAATALYLTVQLFGDVLVLGATSGLALAAWTHAALGTFGAVWRADVWGWLVLLAQLGLVVTAFRIDRIVASGRLLAFAFLPMVLLAGVTVLNPARSSVVAEVWGPLAVAVGAAFAVMAALLRSSVASVAAAAVVLVASIATALLPWQGHWPMLLGFVAGPPALIMVWAVFAAPASPRSSWWAAGGGVLWIVLFFIYYAGYDLGYRADAVLIAFTAIGGITAVAAARTRTVTQAPALPLSHRGWLVGALIGGLAVAAAVLGPAVTVPAAHSTAPDELRVVAYNVRMGYSMAGTFDPHAVASAIAREKPAIVLLSEVDRAWLLNGGQDQLAVLARLLDMPAHFGPAADPVWGDAILTRLPLSNVEWTRLPSFGAVTGAQALTATVDYRGRKVDVVSTHIQPHGGSGDGTLEQTKSLVALLEAGNSGHPMLVGGDFNFEPDSPSWRMMRESGLKDAFVQQRPAATWPADDPEQQIDHIFVSPELRIQAPRVISTLASDHLPVAVSVTLP